MFLKVLEIVFLLVVVAGLVTQILIPLWSNRKMFPIFGKSELGKAIVEVNELSDTVKVTKSIKENLTSIKKDLL